MLDKWNHSICTALGLLSLSKMNLSSMSVWINSFFSPPLAKLAFELRALHLLSRHSTAWATPPTLFTLRVLETESRFLPRLAWSVVLRFYASHCNWDDKWAPPHPAVFHWDGVLRTFCPGWPGTSILLISAFGVARITGVSHCCQALYF
jgi:hypothetical protein